MCTCGYETLAIRTEVTRSEPVARWLAFHPQLEGPGVLTYGKKTLSVLSGIRQSYCTSCSRARGDGIAVGGGTVVEARIASGEVFALMTDIVDPACMEARFVGEGRVYAGIIEVEETSEDNGVLPPEVWTLFEELYEPAVNEEGEPPDEPVGAPIARTVYRVAFPDSADPGIYRLLLRDRCLGVTQPIGDIAIGDFLLTLHERSGHVVAELGDYSGQQLVDEGQSVADQLTAIHAELASRAQVGGDLGGSVAAPQVTGLQGRAVDAGLPVDGEQLTWSAVNQRWESSAPP